MIRKPLYIDIFKEIELLGDLKYRLLEDGLHAGNTVVVTVSTDYSSMVGQYLRHALTHDREICEGFGVDVPYPDETWDSYYVSDLRSNILNNDHLWRKNGKNLLLVEAGVIRGGNYTFVVDYLKRLYSNKILTLALYENEHSKFKSDYVGDYYDDLTQDLTFWWENDNKHWDPIYTKEQ